MNRRGFLAVTIAGTAATLPAAARGPLDGITVASAMRGSINVADFGVWPGTQDDQSEAFAAALARAAAEDRPVFLPAGEYVVSNIRLPVSIRISGVGDASRIVYGGNGYLFAAEDCVDIDLCDLTIDGANRPLGEAAQALVEMRRVARLTIRDCTILGSSKSAVALEDCAGRIEANTISGAADSAIYSVEGRGLRISGNEVSDCGNGGILVHCWQAAPDGTLVAGNRVSRIGATDGGTGQNGNGINVFRAGGVIVSDNHVSDCAFSAIRANSADNVQIVSNQCLASGEAAIFVEFAFEGAVIASNVVDGAAIGISIANLDHGGRMAVCAGNVVRNLVDAAPYDDPGQGFGIGISVEADTSVTGNVVEGAPRYGMMIGWGPFLRNVVATGNVVRETPTGFAVSVVEGAGSALITDNVVDGAAAGVVGYRWAEPVTGDLMRDGTGEFDHLTVERNHLA